jgi:hypothetical protein
MNDRASLAVGYTALRERLRERLGEHHAPAGLYEKNKALPFAGRATCSVSRLEAGEWAENMIY